MRAARHLLPVALIALGLPISSALAQIETREGIALQNQILQLRQELEILRRGGAMAAPQPSTGGSLLGGSAAPPRPAGAAVAPQSELVGQLLDRVSTLEQELRDVRGRAEQAEFRERQLRERVEKLQGDLDFRLQQLEGQGQRQGAAPAQGAPAAAARPTPAPAAAAAPAAASGPRTPQRALSEGQAALGRRDYTAAEAAAREVIGAREAARMQDGYLLLGEALLGKRDFPAAAVAFDDAYKRNQQSSRAPEAMLGVANALIGLNNNREACVQLADIRSRFPNLQGAVAERVADARRRAQCR